MKTTTTFASENIDTHSISKASLILKNEGVVAFPTETVYGLGGSALSDTAVAKIYELKNRPEFNPLIVHVVSGEHARRYVEFNDNAEKLAAKFWPGPLTLVLPRKTDCKLSLLVSAGMDTVAVRMPAHPAARKLLLECGLPIAAPSANKSGRISPTQAAHVREEFGSELTVIDGGDCKIGLESTVVDVTQKTPVLLRPGSVTKEELEAVVGKVDIATANSKIKSPGMLERHYAPTHPLRLNAKEVKRGEGLLAFGKPLYGADVTENLSREVDLREAAANLFRMLRKLDTADIKSIAVMPIPNEGLGIAINDRLKRAAA
jgi:L-threonylcarbamoyladenylate synthase